MPDPNSSKTAYPNVKMYGLEVFALAIKIPTTEQVPPSIKSFFTVKISFINSYVPTNMPNHALNTINVSTRNIKSYETL